MRMQPFLLAFLITNQVHSWKQTVLNAGLGFYANGKVDTIKDGVEMARQVIASGKALEKLRLLQEYQK